MLTFVHRKVRSYTMTRTMPVIKPVASRFISWPYHTFLVAHRYKGS